MGIICFFFRITISIIFRYLLCREASQKKGLRTSKQLANLQDKWNTLSHLIQNWCEVQLVYILHIVILLLQPQSSQDTTVSLPPGVPAENMPLFLLSSLPPHLRALPKLKEEDQVVFSGISGYAYKQADICECPAEQCACYWLAPLKRMRHFIVLL